MAGNNIVNMTIKANMDISQISGSISQMQGILQKLKLPDDMRKQFNSLFNTATADLEKYQSKLQSGFKTKGDVTGLEKIGKGLEATFSSIEKEWSKLQGLDISKLVTLDPSSQARIKEIENSFKTLGTELKSQVAPNLQNITTLINQLSTKSSKKGGAQIAELLGVGQYEQAITLLDQLILKQQKAVDSFDKGNKNAGVRGQTLQQYEAIREALDKVIPKIQEYNNQANNLQSEKIQIFSNATQKANTLLQQGANVAANTAEQMKKYGNAAQQSAQQTQQLGYDLDMIKSRIQYFFSLTNGAMLFRRVLQDTIQTTKELDAAMTETAVVTEFDVSDMWKELPRYTALAKELGTTIKGVYETMTLYYQQGLETNEVFEVGTETLKMARIAGLDYAKATDFMTAALRGFNMEVNEMNAQRINDVYSNLAAITAADTQEIATAMTKTASIASNANMEFETTAAFLSQIIETTRESAETAGTAMKTVIARFTELKKDPAEIGEVDGEIVDANKIETALRTIDVALRGTNGQFRDLDEVFLDIAAKWDGLDTNTQRYIATMAAGSRQQSRFIAMMSDYGRTMELVNAANNSAGASQKQFDKTLESLEAKLNRLKDAWDEFIMGIANSDIIKGAIDLITELLEGINSLTRNLPGASKGIGNLLIMITGFMAGKKIINAFFASTLTNIGGLTKAGMEGGTAYGMSFNTALRKEFGKTGSLIKTIFAKKTWINAGTMAAAQRAAMPQTLIGERNKANLGLANAKGMQAFASKKGNAAVYEKATAAIARNEAQIKSLQATEQAYYAASVPQQNAFIAAKEAGVPIDQANIALTRELTEEDYKQFAVQSLMNSADYTGQELTEEEIKDRIALIKTKQAELNTDKMGLATKAKNIALLFLGNPAQKKEARERLVAAGSTWAQKIALDGLNLSLGTNIALLTLGIALIAGLVIGLVALAKWSEKQTLEYKMEKAAEATERAKKAAEAGKQAYEDLNSSIEEIGTAEDELKKLTYGTIEWQKALLAVNDQILELINSFPGLRDELLNELQVDSYGKLSLSTEGYDIIRKQTLEQYKNLVAGQAISGTYEAFLQQQAVQERFDNANNIVIEVDKETGEKIKEDFAEGYEENVALQYSNYTTSQSSFLQGLESLYNLLFGKKAPGQEEREIVQANISKKASDPYKDHEITDSEKEQIYDKYISNPEIFIEGKQELFDFSKELGISTDSIMDFIPVIKLLREAEIEHAASLRAQSKQILLATTSDNFRANSDANQFTDSISTIFENEKEADIEEKSKKLETVNDINIGTIAEEYGITNFTAKGSPLENLRGLYQALTGLSPEEIEEIFGSSTKSLADAIAQIKVGRDWGKNVEQFYNDFKNFDQKYNYKGYTKDGKRYSTSKTEQQALNDLFSGGDGQGFTLDTLDQLISKEAQQALWDSSSEGLQKMFSSVDEFSAWIAEQRKLAKEQYNYATKDLATFGIISGTTTDGKNAELKELFGGNISVNSLKGLTDKYLEVFKSFGSGQAQDFANTIKDITSEMSDEDAEKFRSALNGIDWSNKEQVLGFSETLESLGIDLQAAGYDVDKLEEEFLRFGKATTKISLENLTETIQELGQLSVQIQTKEKEGRGFSKEEKELLLKAGVVQEKDFSFNVETGDYTYLGESTDKIVAAIKEQTNELLGSKDYEYQLTSGNVVKQVKDAIDYTTTDYAGKATFISDYNKAMGYKRDKDGNLLDENGNITTDENKAVKITSPYSAEFINALTAEGAADDTAIQAEIDRVYNEIMQHYLGLANNEQKWLESQKAGGIAHIQTNSTSGEILDNLFNLRGTNEDNVTADIIAKNKSDNAAEIEKYTIALTEQAVAVEVSQSRIDAYRKKLNELNNATDPKDIQILTTEVEDLERELANTIGFNKANKAMQTSIEKTIELLDGYEDLKEEFSKIQQVQKMIDSFGLDYKVDSSNYQLIHDYMLGIAQGSYTAYQNLIQLTGSNWGITITADGDFGNLKKGIEGTEQDYIDFINTMIENGAFVEETVDITNTQDYVGAMVKEILPDGTTKITPITEEMDLNGAYTIIRPKKAGEIKTVVTQSDGGENYSPSKSERWKTSRTAYDNINSDINNQVKERNRLEKEYELLLQDENSTVEDFTKNYEQRLGTLQQEIALQKHLLEMREAEREKLKENSYYGKYAWIDDNGEVKIDYQALASVKNSEEGEKIEEFISVLEDNVESTDETKEALQENNLALKELQDEWRDLAGDLEKRIYDALVSEREREIERMENIASTLEESNDELISAIQEEIDLRRQQRDNEEKEKQISDKERRLSYLQRDTSGGNAQEILELQKELGEEKQDYTDTLIDQKIEELEKQNEEAAKQRERQIRILEYQLENDKNTGKIAEEARRILENATSPEGYRRAYQLLAKSEAVDAMTQIEREVWEEKTQGDFKTALAYLNSDDFKNLGTSIISGVSGYVDDALAGVVQTLGDPDDDDDEPPTSGYDGTYHAFASKELTFKDKDGNSVSKMYYKVNGNWYKKDELDFSDDGKKAKVKDEVDRTIFPNWAPVGSSMEHKEVDGEAYYYYNGNYYLKGNSGTNRAFWVNKDGKLYVNMERLGDPKFMYKELHGKMVPIDTKEPPVEKPSTTKPSTTKPDSSPITYVKICPYNTKFSTDGQLAYMIKDEDKNKLVPAMKMAFFDPNSKWMLGDTVKQDGQTYYELGSTGMWLPDDWVYLTTYKTGGLADFTGPAWLDGTKSRPELVLNQKDTQNFLQLKDILGSFMKNKSTINNNSTGNTNYEISINVESISSDYDVDRAAERVKQIISSEALYRNSNLINRLR